MIYPSRPYPAYKPSGVPWLGDVPEHWALPSVKQCYEVQLGKMLQPSRMSGDDREVPYLKALHVQWFAVNLTPPSTMWANPRDVKQFSIREGDLLVCEGGDGGRAGIVKSELTNYIIQNALHRVRPTDGALNEYLLYVLFVASSIGWLNAVNNKATIAHFTREKLTALRIPLPPLPEQRAIVRYLDYVDRRIRRYVSAKRKLIALLEEEKQAIVNRAVTRGLDPNVHLKPSGVEWLGDVPEHWEIRRLRSLANIGTGGRDTINREDDGKYPFFVRSQSVEKINTWSFDGEAVLTAGDGVGVGKVFHYINGKFDYHQRVYKFSNFRHVVGKYFFHFFRSTLRNEVFQGTAKSTVDSLRLPMLQNFPVALPPLQEQHAIVESLEDATVGVDAAIARARRQIELLQEFRTRLIADVVTGKLDVREAAALLPDEDDEAEPMAERDLQVHGMDDDLYNADNLEEESAIESEVKA